MSEENAENKLSIICFSGDYDKALATLIVATGAKAFDWEVNLFYTFWGLNIIKKNKGRKPLGKTFLEKAFNVMMGGNNKLPLSRLNLGGLSPILMESMMKKKGAKSVEQLLQDAIALECNIFACEMAMNTLGIAKEELIDEAKIVGVASYLAEADNGQMLFI